MLCINGKSNKQRRKEDNLKEERTPECCFRCPAFSRGHNKKDGEQEVVETHGGKAAQFLQHQFLQQGQKG
jgi:hypothetical protein